MDAVRRLPCPYQRAALLVARWSGTGLVPLDDRSDPLQLGTFYLFPKDNQQPTDQTWRRRISLSAGSRRR